MKHICRLLLVTLCLMLPLAAMAEDARVMPEPYASATFTDPSVIPYPQERDENGYLIAGSAVTSYREADAATGELEAYGTEGEFVYENPAQGLWAYLSPTVQVRIVQYDGHWYSSFDKKEHDQRWFVADVMFDTSAEQFTQHPWYLEDVTGMNVMGPLRNGVTRGNFARQEIWPKTLAQADRMVIAVNGDYNLNRKDKKTTGNIIRQGRVLYDVSNVLAYPNLDCAAFFPDGSMKVYDARETTATALLEEGAQDVVCFGPWLVRDGELRVYDGANHDNLEPRLAIGMVEPGHLVIIDCEGRVPDGPRGLDLNELAALMYYNGANEAINMDGGNTTVLIFMGEKLNRTGHDTYISSPRNQEELFGVGKSELVRTDWVNGDPKKK